MRILRLYLENWRNFTRVNVSLQQRVFIAGPNASGKSNLLDAIRFLQDIASTGGGLQKAVSDRGGVSKVRCLAARRYSDVTFEIDLGDDIDDPEWRYENSFNQDRQRRLHLKREIVVHNNEIILQRPDREDKRDLERLTQTHLEQVSANHKFREITEFLASVRYLHVVPQLIREPERRLPKAESDRDPFGGDFLEHIARTPDKTSKSRLRRIKDALKIAVPQLHELILQRDEFGVPHLSGRFEHWRPQAGWQGEDQFSDGTLRLMGLLWAVLDGNGPLLLEEPELSLHPEVVRSIPQMLWQITRKRRRQIILTTHSAELLEDTGIAPDEVLLLHPSAEGTSVTTAKSDEKLLKLLKGGFSMAEAVLPTVAPQRADQLAFFE
jgi:predicted ATPase